MRHLSVACVLLLAAPLHATQIERAVTVRDGYIYVSPDRRSAKLADLSRGREINILEPRGTTPGWLHVFANVERGRDVTGWMLDKGVVSASTPDGDRVVYGEAVDSEAEASKRRGRKNAAEDAARLYWRVHELFPKSPLAAEALYRAADIRWQLERVNVPRPSKGANPRMPTDVEETWMKMVIKEYPGTKWADLAAFSLLDNKICGLWEGSVKCPEKESEIYEKYAAEHPNSPKAPEALYLAAWRQAALVEMYKGNGDSGRSAAAKQRALALAGRVASTWPQTDWGPRAQRLAYLVQQEMPLLANVVE